MKKITIAILVPAFFIIMFNACNIINDPIITPTDETAVTVAFPTLDPASVYRKVLIEDYTAARCPNCAAIGHVKLEELHTRYGDTLIAVGLHTGPLAAPMAGFPYDFRTATGTALAAVYGIDGIPAGIINRSYEAGGWNPARWKTQIENVDRSTVYAAIQTINQWNTPSTDKLKINTKVTMLADYTAPLRLSLFLIEDSIIQPQEISATETVENYVHNHVLRSGINGTYGTLLNGDGLLQKDSSYTYGYVLNFAGHDWNAAHCSVVAILYDKENDEVLQVEKIAVQ